jgi:hypothetical protein
VLIAKALLLSGKSRRTLGVGAIISHLQMDCRLMSQAIVNVNMAWGIPAQLALCVFLLYRQLGNAAFAGFVVTAVMSPIIFVMTQYAKTYRRLVMKRRDKRIKFLTELLQGAKTIKVRVVLARKRAPDNPGAAEHGNNTVPRPSPAHVRGCRHFCSLHREQRC